MNKATPDTEKQRERIEHHSSPVSYLQQKELDRLATLLRNATGGTWAVALYNTVAVRDHVMQALRDRLHSLPVYDFTFTKTRANPLAYLERLSPEMKEQRAIVFLYDLTRSGERVWGYLEMQREALADYPHGLVFWMTPAERGEALRKAPNFWSQRSGVFDFTIADDRALMQMRRAGSEQSARFADKADWERKVRLYQGLLEEYKQCNDVPADTQMDLYHKLFMLQYTVGNYQKAQDLVQEQLVLARNTEDEEQTAQGLYNLGLVYTDLGEWDRAIDIYQQSLQTYERLGDVRGKAQTLNNLGSVYAQKGEWDRAIAKYEQSLEIKEILGELHGIAQTWVNLGNLCASQGQWDRAINLYRQSIDIYKRSEDMHGMADALTNLGNVYRMQGKWDGAIEMYQQSMEIDQRLGNTQGMAEILNNLGIVFRKKGDWQQALEIFEQSLELFEQVGDMHGAAHTLNNLGNVYTDRGEWERALEVYQRSLETYQRLGDVHSIAQTWGNLGNVYAEKREWDQAFKMYNQGLEVLERIGDRHGVAQALGNIGTLHLQTNSPNKAKLPLARATLIFAQLGSPHQQTAARKLVQAFDGDVDAANAYLDQIAGEMQANDESSKP